MARPKLVVAEEQPMFGEMLARTLEPEFDVVSKPRDSRSLIAAAKLEPDVVVLDVKLAVVGGVEAVRAVLAASPSTRVVIFTI
jgi:DNA-binding NarL/FixJ family response regulator